LLNKNPKLFTNACEKLLKVIFLYCFEKMRLLLYAAFSTPTIGIFWGTGEAVQAGAYQQASTVVPGWS
jgi:hypothetical protein